MVDDDKLIRKGLIMVGLLMATMLIAVTIRMVFII